MNAYAPKMHMLVLADRVRLFARGAVLVERAIGLPTEVIMAHWAITTNWGRDQADYLGGHDTEGAIMANAKMLQEAGGTGEYLEIAARLDPWFTGLFDQAKSGHLHIACEQARREVTPEAGRHPRLELAVSQAQGGQ